MGVHYYLPALTNELAALTFEHSLNFKKLSTRSIRVMNRFARTIDRYIEANRYKMNQT